MNIEFYEYRVKSFILPTMKGACMSQKEQTRSPLARARPSVKLRDEKCIKPGCFIFQCPIFLSSCVLLSFLSFLALRRHGSLLRVATQWRAYAGHSDPQNVSRGLSKNARTLVELLRPF